MAWQDSANSETTSSTVGIGTPTVAARSQLTVVGGALAIGAAPPPGGVPAGADAAIHVSSSFGPWDRLLQMGPDPSQASKPGLNLLASNDANKTQQWWAWGVTPDNTWRIQPGAAFFDPTPALTIDAAGNTGIGTFTNSPQARLSVVGGALTVGTQPITADAAIHISCSFGIFDRLLQMSPAAGAKSKPGLNLLAYTDAGGNQQWWAWGVNADNTWRIQPGEMFDESAGLTIDAAGNVHVAADVLLTGADCAEQFDLVDGVVLEPGSVVVIDEQGALSESHQAYDRKVAGVISGAGAYKHGIVLDTRPSEKSRAPVALVGKVYCKVDAEYGAINVGDLLTTSSTFGHAMKANDPVRTSGAVLGKALKPLNRGQGLIPVLVALQ